MNIERIQRMMFEFMVATLLSMVIILIGQWIIYPKLERIEKRLDQLELKEKK